MRDLSRYSADCGTRLIELHGKMPLDGCLRLLDDMARIAASLSHLPVNHEEWPCDELRRYGLHSSCKSCAAPPTPLEPKRVPVVECIHGHPFDLANTYLRRGKRTCRTCSRERKRSASKQGAQHERLN